MSERRNFLIEIKEKCFVIKLIGYFSSSVNFFPLFSFFPRIFIFFLFFHLIFFLFGFHDSQRNLMDVLYVSVAEISSLNEILGKNN